MDLLVSSNFLPMQEQQKFHFVLVEKIQMKRVLVLVKFARKQTGPMEWVIIRRSKRINLIQVNVQKNFVIVVQYNRYSLSDYFCHRCVGLDSCLLHSSCST